MANSIIRHEINILGGLLTAAGGSSTTSLEIVQTNRSHYASPTFYFEVVADSTVSISFTVTLRRAGTSTDDATCTIPLLSTAFTRVRSTAFTPFADGQNYVVFIDATAGATKNVNSARLIIIDSAATVTTSLPRFAIGAKETGKTNTASAALTTPKYWTYTAANWATTGGFKIGGAVSWSTSAKNTCTITLQEDNGSFASWADVLTIVNAGSNSTGSTYSTANSYVPVDGRHYRLASLGSTTKSTYSIYNAFIQFFLVTGTGETTKMEEQYLFLDQADGGTGVQSYMELWDSTEWNDTQGGLPVFKYTHDASNASDSSKLIDVTNANADVTGATVTGANQQISSAFTMPTTGHTLDTNVTNSTGVVGATRVIALWSKGTAALVSTHNKNYVIRFF